MLNERIIMEYVMTQFSLKYKTDKEYPVNYSGIISKDARININSSGSDFLKDAKPFPERIFFKKVLEQDIPFLFGDEQKDIVTNEHGTVTVNYDIIASSFYFLSGWQEKFCSTKDEFGRFPYNESIQKKYDLQTIPVVNYYFTVLKDAIEMAYGVKLQNRVAENFSCFLTHDIDELKTIWMQESFHALKKRKIANIFPQVMKKIKGNNVGESIDSVESIEKKHQIRSTYFFLVRKGNVNEFKNADYDIKENKITALVNGVKSSGNEIALHGSFFTHNSKKNLEEDKTVLSNVISNENIYGNRFHYLCFDIDKTPGVLEGSGFRYDSTLGFAEHTGFRNSYSDPFYLFNWEEEKMSKVIEFPLTVMDVSLYFSQYMHISQSESFVKIKKLIDQIKKINGCLVLNWHNTSYLKNKNMGWDKLLDEIIIYCKSLGGNFFTFEDYINKYVPGISKK
ncbi:MAG: hypothetical protein ABI462_05540 [Ignavibacteria bacterium]